MRIVAQLDDEGFFVAAVVADKSPLEQGVYLLPGRCIDKAPPAVVEPGKRYRVWGAGWRGEDMPAGVESVTGDERTPQQVRREEITIALADIDAKSVRPARELAIALAQGLPVPPYVQGKLAGLEDQAVMLREELAALGV